MKRFYCKLLAGFAIGLISILMFAPFFSPLQAQSFYGSIVGTVTDSSGAVVPGASVTLTNVGTSEKHTGQTDAAGSYRFVNLVPANYRLEVEASGFKRLTREPIAVTVDAAIRIDAVLQVGAITETISVSSETPLLQTESGSVGQTIEGRHVLEMPLNGRNPMNLIALVPGVVPQGSSGGAALGNQVSAGNAHTMNLGWGNYQIGGGIAGQSATFLDGVPLNVGGGGNSIGLVAVQDAVQEFRVVTNNVSAEFGRFSGGVVNMTTKSGTNEFHGALYEYIRNKVLNANYFFSNATGMARAPWVQNQYGATIGGPVRKDKTFFFFTWENYALRFAGPTITTVPTDAQRAGNFGSTAIYDPLTTQVVGGKVTRTQFANNTIPASRIDNAANVIANTIKYWRSPNVNLASGNFASTTRVGGDTGQYNVRIDQNISDRQRLFGRFTYWHLADIPYNPLMNMIGNPPTTSTTKSVVVGDTYTFTPQTVLDIRVSYLRQYLDDIPIAMGADLSQFGPAWASLNNLVAYHFLPKISMSGLYGGGAQDNFDYRYWNNYFLSAGLTKIQGRHTFKFGGELRLMDNNVIGITEGAGTFTFNTAFTSANATTASSAGGNAFASFLLGYPSTGLITTGQWVGQYSWYQGYYFTDVFQASRKLTLNYGLRWELPGALAERHNLATVLLPDATDSLSQATGLKLKGQLALVNSSQWPDRTVQAIARNLFAPRVGFAYRITNQIVLLGGYAISYLPNNAQIGKSNVSPGTPFASPINAATLTMSTSVNNAGQIPLNTLSIPFPAGGVPGTIQQQIVQPSGRSQSFLDSLKGGNVDSMIPEQPYPYVQQWNINVERQLRGNTLIEIGYAGNKGTHLPIGTFNLNQLPDQYDSMGSALLAKVTNPFYGLVPATNTLGSATINAGQLLRLYPQYLNFTADGLDVGSTTYHAMMAKVEKRFGAGGVLMANYTWSKMLTNTETLATHLESGTTGGIQNYNNFQGERSLTSFDVPHRMIVSYVLDIPFGKGRKFLSGTTGFTGKLVSGWGVNGIISFQKGFPLSLVAQATTLSQSFGAGTPRPNVDASCSKQISGSAQSRLNQWFNIACFSQPGSYNFGSEGRTDPQLRSDGINNFDFAAFKSTGITERVKLQFRAEFFNIFNHVRFSPPATTLGVTTFGTVSTQANQPRVIQFALRLTF